MKILVLGGTGLIGSKVVRLLKEGNHDVIAGSARTVDLLTGKGLSEALQGIQVVVDLTNSPSFEDAAVLNFFQTAARNLFPAEAAAGVHPGAIVGTVRGFRVSEENRGLWGAMMTKKDIFTDYQKIADRLLRSSSFKQGRATQNPGRNRTWIEGHGLIQFRQSSSRIGRVFAELAFCKQVVKIGIDNARCDGDL